MDKKFQEELRELINRKSMENCCNIPDFLLAEYLERCLDALSEAVNERDRWYGVSPMVGGAEKATLDVKTTIEQELIELVGAKFYQLDQLYRGKHPTEYDITEWVKMYRGREDLQPPFIELNTFRNEVNNFVSLLMSVISRHI